VLLIAVSPMVNLGLFSQKNRLKVSLRYGNPASGITTFYTSFGEGQTLLPRYPVS